MEGRARRGSRYWGWAAVAAFGGVLVLLVTAVVDRPAVLAGGAMSSGGGEMTWEEREIAIGVECLRVQVADTPEKRNQGLRGRDSLGEFDGMVFLWGDSAERAFTMSGVKFPLTIGFYDDAGRRVDALDMEPCSGDDQSCPLYHSRHPFKTALEVAKGRLPEGSYMPVCLARSEQG